MMERVPRDCAEGYRTNCEMGPAMLDTLPDTQLWGHVMQQAVMGSSALTPRIW